MKFLRREHIHFIGIGGAGMFPLAEMLQRYDFPISGSDKESTYATHYLQSAGIAIQYHHEPALVKTAQRVVYSSAIKENNAELTYARNRGIPCIKRAKLLGDLTRTAFSIGVAGTHGKTTTTALIGTILRDAGMAPTIIAGASFCGSDSHAVIGTESLLVFEADEYDRSFLDMYPSIAVITNIETDHLDIYKDLDDIVETFTLFGNKVPFYGLAVLCSDDDNVKRICNHVQKPVVTYGVESPAQYRAGAISFEQEQSVFTLYKEGSSLGTVTIPLGGVHNVRNALAAVAVCCELAIPFDIIKQSLYTFKGVKRRFQVIGTENSITIIDDYAHHPTEICATLDAAKRRNFKRIVAVFQPHLYSRTRDFYDAFVQSLLAADIVFITDIYPAREKPIAGVDSKGLVDALKQRNHAHAYYLQTIDAVTETVFPMLRHGDGVILMGAGDIGKMGVSLLQRLKNG